MVSQLSDLYYGNTYAWENVIETITQVHTSPYPGWQETDMIRNLLALGGSTTASSRGSSVWT